MCSRNSTGQDAWCSEVRGEWTLCGGQVPEIPVDHGKDVGLGSKCAGKLIEIKSGEVT